MMSILSPRWILNTFVTVFVTMIFIYIIKRVAKKYEIPVVEDIAEGI